MQVYTYIYIYVYIYVKNNVLFAKMNKTEQWTIHRTAFVDKRLSESILSRSSVAETVE